MDPADPAHLYWRRSTEGSVFRGPLFCDRDLILHVSDEKTGTVEAIDPASGAPLWSLPLRDAHSGERVVGPAGPGMVRVRKELPDNYRVRRGDDGMVYIRTFKRVFEVDPKNGEVRRTVRSDHEIGDFHAAPGGAAVYGLDGETGAVRGFLLEAPEALAARDVENIVDVAPSGPPPTIEVEDSVVIIGGVSVPRKS